MHMKLPTVLWREDCQEEKPLWILAMWAPSRSFFLSLEPDMGGHDPLQGRKISSKDWG